MHTSARTTATSPVNLFIPIRIPCFLRSFLTSFDYTTNIPGEADWVRKMIDMHDDKARETGMDMFLINVLLFVYCVYIYRHIYINIHMNLIYNILL